MIIHPGEMRVLKLLGHAESDKQIANRLGISVHTVKAHIKALRRKTGTANRTALTLWALHYRHTEDYVNG